MQATLTRIAFDSAGFGVSSGPHNWWCRVSTFVSARQISSALASGCQIAVKSGENGTAKELGHSELSKILMQR